MPEIALACLAAVAAGLAAVGFYAWSIRPRSLVQGTAVMADAFSHPPPDPGSLATLWAWLSAPVAGVFGAGVVWGATHSTQADHGRRIGALEANTRTDVAALRSDMSANHRQVIDALLRISRGEPLDLA